jgi:hypothetical protein
MLNEDYKEILQILLNNDVEFLVVGAYAMAAYGYPRATGDFDIWVETTSENSKKIYNSLSEFGAPLSEITESIFEEKDIVFQVGISPRRIDIITNIDGVEFKDAYRDREEIDVENLIKNKKATGREKDKLDIKYLQEK